MDEYDFLVKSHEDYRSDKLNEKNLLPPIEIEIEGKKVKIIKS